MFKKLSGLITFGSISILFAIGLAIYLYREEGWNFYQAWLLSWSLSAFVLWWIDHTRKKVPNNIFYLQALMGGFIGAWLGMFGFWYRVSHKTLWLVLIASTIIHSALMKHFL